MRNHTNRSSRGRRTGNILLAIGCLAVAGLAWGPRAVAQEEEQKGVASGDYNVKQSVEFGGRVTSFGGNLQVYNSFVNLKGGPRLFGFTLEMQSLDHHATFFDTLYFSNSGYGGDPNNVSRLRIGKLKWFDFTGQFRRDENFWDYSLQANPLNPVTPAFANAPAGFSPLIQSSPHAMNTRRKLSDFGLTLLPQGSVRFRLGYSRNINEGPSFTTIHQSTEQFLFQQWKTTVNDYHLGVDFRLLPRTNVSYDQFWNYYKGDTGQVDRNQLFALANGSLVDIGISLNAGANQPCAGTFLPPPAPAGTVNPACSAAFGYTRAGRMRSTGPTEQISLQSTYFKDWDLSARFSYTGGDTITDNFSEVFTGWEGRTGLRNFGSTGPVFGRRVSANADFGATWHITKSLSFLDSFRYSNFHNPVEFDASTCQFFSPGLLTPANVFAPAFPVPLACARPADGVTGTPVHNSSSGPDISVAISSLLLKQSERTNLAEIEYQFTSRIGARLGYRIRHREIADTKFTQVNEIFFPSNGNRGDCALVAGVLPAGCTALGGGAFQFQTPTPGPNGGETLIDSHAGVFGIWARPASNWRISFDTELVSADNSFTRISPRQWQEYRVRSTYKPVAWANVSGSIRIWEARNNVPEINNLQHNRSYGITAAFDPIQKFAIDLGYDYDDVFSSILICYTSSTAPAGLAKCPGIAVLVQQVSTYTNTSHYGFVDLRFTPWKKLTARLGANLTGTSGSALLLDPIAPPGTLDSKYYKPYGGIDYNFAKGWTARAFWNYYGYSEGQSGVAQDLFSPRNFRGNLVNLTVRYAF